MNPSGDRAHFNCSGHCHDCSLFDAVPAASGGWAGWWFAFAAAGIFLMPLLLTILGAVGLQAHPNLQVLGGLGGFVVGVLAARVLIRFIPSIRKADPCPLS